MSSVQIGIGTFIVAAVTSLLLTPWVIRFGARIGAVDHPGPRKVHNRPIPRIGGVSIYFGCLAGVAFAAHASGYIYLEPKIGYWCTLGGAATVLFLLGFVDDLKGVSFQWKFAVQIAAAVAVWSAGFRIETISYPLGAHPMQLGGFSLPVTVLWIVGITNALNLIDGLDGLASGTALITTSAVAVASIYGHKPGLAAASVALMGSLFAFLRYNFNPARIFLGDSGSMFLGFVLAVTSIHASQKGPTVIAVLAPLLALGLPILDTSLAIVRRLYRLGTDRVADEGRFSYVARNAHRVFLPDRGHLHHRLLDLGLSHRAVVLSLYAVGILLSMAALSIVVINSVTLAIALLVVLASSFAIWMFFMVRVARRGRRAAADKADSARGPAVSVPRIAGQR